MTKEKNKKLLIVTDYFYPHWTGISKSIYYLLESLQNELQIAVLTVRFKKNLKKEETIFFANIIREEYIFSLSRSKYSITILFKFLSLVSSYDVVLINSPSSNILFFTLFAKIFKKKIVIFHQADLNLPNAPLNRIINILFVISHFVAYFLADTVSTYSGDFARHSFLLKHFQKKMIPTLLPVSLPINKKKIIMKIQRLKNLQKDKEIIFGFSGRFVEEKGFDILFDAIPQITEHLPKVKFIFAGEINVEYEDFYKKTLSKLEKVKKYITFLGLLEENELVNFYESIDFIVVPSRIDCFNLSQAEAMLYGVPSIVSNIPGARYMVLETGFGILFEKESSGNLARKIVQIVENAKLISEKYENVLKILDTKKCTARIKKILS